MLPGANKPGTVAPRGIAGFRDLNSFNDTFFYELASVYMGRLSYVDFLLGRLVAGVDASPLANATAVFFSSSSLLNRSSSPMAGRRSLGVDSEPAPPLGEDDDAMALLACWPAMCAICL